MKRIFSYLGSTNALALGGILISLLVMGWLMYDNAEKLIAESETRISHLKIYGRKGPEPVHQYRHTYLEAEGGFPSVYLDELIIAVHDAADKLGNRVVVTKVMIGDIDKDEVRLTPDEVLVSEVTTGLKIYGVVIRQRMKIPEDKIMIFIKKFHSDDMATTDMSSVMSVVDTATYNSEGDYKGAHVTKVVVVPVGVQVE